MSYTSSEFYGASTNPSNEYSLQGKYYEGSQFGPAAKPTTPQMKFPSIPIIPKEFKDYGINSLTHDFDGQNYYNVETAYGKVTEPAYYVAHCPSNKFVRPFGHNTVHQSSSTLVPNQLISEGYESDAAAALGDLDVVFFYDPISCKYSKIAYNELDDVRQAITLKDINHGNNLQLMTNLGGYATPFFFSKKSGRSATGIYKISDLIIALSVHHGRRPTPTPTPSPEYFETPAPTSGLLIGSLKLELFVLKGCHHCDNMKDLLSQKGLLQHVKITDAHDAPDRVRQAAGFPYLISNATGKSHTGYHNDIEAILKKLA